MDKKEEFKLADELRKAEVPKEKRKIILENVHEKLEKERTMKLSIKEAAASSVMTGFGDQYITPYALSLNSNNIHIGFLSSLPGLISPISQIFSSKLMEKSSRKKIMIASVFLQALMWLPILILSFLFQKNIFSSHLPTILIVFYTIYAIFGSFAGPAWFSLMGDIVPEKIRGKYFGERNKVATVVFLIAMILAAFILDFSKTKGYVLIGFSILFFLASVFRLFSVGLLKKHYDPKFKLEKGYYFSIFQFIKKAPSNNFGRFVIFASLIYLTTNIAGPFFAVYMLKDLNFSYTTFMLVNISSSIFSVLFMPVWGKFSDKFGNRELLKLGSILIPFLPIFWLFSKSPYYLAFVPQLLGGIGWAAFNLAASNFIYDSVSVQRRGLCVSYYNVFCGIGIFLGATLGGFLANYVTITFINTFLFIFLVSGVTRLIVVLILMPKVKEVRQVKRKSSLLLNIKEAKPMQGVIYEIFNDIKTARDGIKKVGKKKLSFDF